MFIERAYQVIRAVAVLCVATAITLLALPPKTRSQAWHPPRAPNYDGPFTPNAVLLDADRIVSGELVGPEDVLVDELGRVTTGTADGKIVRTRVDGSLEVLTETGGRPLGLAFGPSGDLFVADVLKGLLRVDTEGNIEVLAREAEGLPLVFTNAVVAARDGTLFFTDSSSKWGYGKHVLDMLEQVPSGRLLKRDPSTGALTVLLRNLAFANGVALAPDESYLLVNETARYRTTRLWLQGEKKNLAEPFLENLHGFPDNIHVTERGTYWIALYAPRKGLLDRIHPYPFLKDALSSLPRSLMPQPQQWGIAFEVDGNGRVLRSIHDPTGRRFRHVSSAFESHGVLYVGTLSGTAIGRLVPPPFPP